MSFLRVVADVVESSPTFHGYVAVRHGFRMLRRWTPPCMTREGAWECVEDLTRDMVALGPLGIDKEVG